LIHCNSRQISVRPYQYLAEVRNIVFDKPTPTKQILIYSLPGMTTAVQRAAYQYNYTEPHPTVKHITPLSTGRGGAGNRTTVCPITTTAGATATGPASRSLVAPVPTPRRLSSGRGGAGNVKPKAAVANPNEPTLFELEREARHNHEDAISADKRVWHYGRGGEGNLINQKKVVEKGKLRVSEVEQRRGSNESVISTGSSVASDFAERIRRGSRAGSFTEKLAARLGARRGSRDSTKDGAEQ